MFSSICKLYGASLNASSLDPRSGSSRSVISRFFEGGALVSVVEIMKSSVSKPTASFDMVSVVCQIDLKEAAPDRTSDTTV
eukprot:g11590.t1